MKDNFSLQSDLYARFRPGYPKQLFDFLLPLVPEKNTAWDCGTGNGQVAVKLAGSFKAVHATDISAAQLRHAPQRENIFYHTIPAEQDFFAQGQFDLITVAQAIHWFDRDRFFAQVSKTLRPGAILAIIGYDILQINQEIDGLINDFYHQATGPYWDTERKLVEDHYANIAFPFKEIAAPGFWTRNKWSFEELLGYLNTWSAVQHYIRKHNANPVDTLAVSLRKAWGDVGKRNVAFPVFMRVGRK